jgi:hypothetical protein
MWDYSGEHGDTILLTLKPAATDVGSALSVAIFLESRANSAAAWQQVQCSATGTFLGYSSGMFQGQAFNMALFQINQTDPIDVSLRIPAVAYTLPAGNHDLRYRVRTAQHLRNELDRAPQFIDDVIIPGTITANFQMGGARVAHIPRAEPPANVRAPFSCRGAASGNRPPADRERPRLVEFNFGN